MANGLMSIGASGLSAAYVALQTTGHNIANVSTPGYKRQQVVLRPVVPQFTGGGYLGKGVEVSAITRAWNQITTAEANRAQSGASEANEHTSALTRLVRVLGDSENGVGAAVNGWYTSAEALVARPSDAATRAAFVDQVRNLANQFADASEAINVLRTDATRTIELSVATVNDLTAQIAKLNDRIAVGLATGQTPNDLMDQRDALVRAVADEIGVTTVTQSDGAVNLYVGNGQALVVGATTNRIAVAADVNDPAKRALSVVSGSGSVLMGTSGAAFGGGRIAAMFTFNNENLGHADAELGRLATAIATAANTQHQAGLDPTGTAGGPLFVLGPAPVIVGSGNTGNASISLAVSDASALKASDYQLAFDGANFQLTRLSDGVQQSFAALPATLDGVSISISGGAFAAGDTFVLKPVSLRANAMSAALIDPSKIATALPVAANASLNNAGNTRVDGLDVNNAANGNLTSTVTLAFTSATTFDVSGAGTGNPLGVAYSSGGTISYNGWSLTLSGTPRVGDVITVALNGNAAGDNRNARKIAAAGTAHIVDGQTPAQSFAGLLASVGSTARSAELSARAQSRLRDDAIAAESSISGVNLDEEAAKLMQYQQAYQASAKLIAAAESVFSTLLDLGR